MTTASLAVAAGRGALYQQFENKNHDKRGRFDRKNGGRSPGDEPTLPPGASRDDVAGSDWEPDGPPPPKGDGSIHAAPATGDVEGDDELFDGTGQLRPAVQSELAKHVKDPEAAGAVADGNVEGLPEGSAHDLISALEKAHGTLTGDDKRQAEILFDKINSRQLTVGGRMTFRDYPRDSGTGRFKPKGAPDTPTFDAVPPGWSVGTGEDLGELTPALSDEAWSALDREAQAHLAANPGDALYATRQWPFDHARIRRSLASDEPNKTSRDFLAEVAGAPPVDGITYRGVHGSSSLNQDRAYWDDHVGAVLNWQVPSSSSLRPDVAARQVPVPGTTTRPRTIFEIRGKGNYIGAVTGGYSQEVVMPAGRYKVRSVHSGRVRQTTSIKPGLRGGEAIDKVFPGPDDVTVVRLEQL